MNKYDHIEECKKLLEFYDDCYDINSYFYNTYGKTQLMFRKHKVGERYWTIKVGESAEWRKIDVNDLVSYIGTFLDIDKINIDLKDGLQTGAAYAKIVLKDYESFFGSDEVHESYLGMKRFGEELVSAIEVTLKKKSFRVVEPCSATAPEYCNIKNVVSNYMSENPEVYYDDDAQLSLFKAFEDFIGQKN